MRGVALFGPGVPGRWRRCTPDGRRRYARLLGQHLRRLDLLPRWAQAWYRLPFLDRYAHTYMWHHGAWETAPADPRAG